MQLFKKKKKSEESEKNLCGNVLPVTNLVAVVVHI